MCYQWLSETHASIDLKDAYYNVPIDPLFRKYLSSDRDGRLHQFTSLPNGLSSAPNVFTKLMKRVFSQLRKQGFTNVCCIHDILWQGDSYEECLENVNNTSQLVDDLGLTFYPRRSILPPINCNCSSLCFW